MYLSNYSEFEKYLFDRKADENIKWFFHDNFLEIEFDSNDLIRFASKIYLNIHDISLRYSDVQICLGLEYLINQNASLACYSFFDQEVAEIDRCCTIRNMFQVFLSIFDKKCLHCVSHDSSKIMSAYNALCYMWWDIFPRHGVPRTHANKQIDFAVIETLEKILSLANIACIESGLHGLGHWHSGYPEEIENIIQKKIDNIPNELKKYAQKAMVGDVQ